MKNKVFFIRFLICSLILSIVIATIFMFINMYEYNSYTKNYNNKINGIISIVVDKYPDITKNEILEILNSKENNNILNEFGIDINKESVLSENDHNYKKYSIYNLLYLVISLILLTVLFILYNNKKDKEIKKIIKCIEEINKKNYKLEIDDISEDELSILKNEIYKTTIMLKEEAENSKKDKIELKDSLSNISHQLKTPLTSMLIILDNLIDNPDMDKDLKEEFLRDLKREVTNISFLVQSILKLSKLDTNTVEFIDKETTLNKIIDSSLRNISILCDIHNMTINKKYEEEVKIKCDFKWNVEAISNILKNCVEHSLDNSYIDIEINDNKVYSEIVISDNGTGIDKEDLPHIFERFYKAKNSKSDSVGIGLSLAKSIVKKDNGDIYVESSNKGTTFKIRYFK